MLLEFVGVFLRKMDRNSQDIMIGVCAFLVSCCCAVLSLCFPFARLCVTHSQDLLVVQKHMKIEMAFLYAGPCSHYTMSRKMSTPQELVEPGKNIERPSPHHNVKQKCPGSKDAIIYTSQTYG